MNRELLSEKISRLTSILSAVETDVDPSILDRFQNGLLTLNGWQTFRVNPLSLAEVFGIERKQILKLFVYGVKAGLFTFEWNLLCPFCGGREHSHANLNQLEKDFYHCTTCDVDVDVTADDHLEISFTIVPEISEFVADPLRSLEDYRRYYYSPYFVPSQAYKEALEQSPPVRFANLKPGGRALVKIGNTPTGKHRFFSLATHSVFTTYLNVTNASHSGKLSIAHDGIEFSQKEAQVDRGPAEVIVSNASGTPLGFLVSSPDSKQIAAAIQKDQAACLS